jgi:hypothetical protein
MLSVLVFVGLPERFAAAGAPPVAIDDGGFQTAVNTPLDIPIATLLANDSDPDGGPVVIDTDHAPFAGNGTVTPNHGAGILVYTPNPGFSGGDRVTYQIEDSEGLLDTASASVFVSAPNAPPAAVNDEYLMGLNETLIVQAAAGLLANDSDPEGDSISLHAYDLSTVPGAIALTGDGGFTYTPPHNLAGTIVFTYSITDGTSVSNVANVAIIVQNPTSPPAARNDSYGTPKDRQLVVSAPGVLGNDSDDDGQSLTAVLADAADFGTVNLQADGAFTYTPNAGFVGADSFGYQAFDGTRASGTAFVTINVSATNLPPVPVNDEFQTGRNAALPIPFQALLANDTDVDGPALSVLTDQVGLPTSGILQVDAGASRFIYTPNSDFIGVDFFSYRISDGTAASEQAATVRITVTNLVAPSPTPTPTAGSGATPEPTAPDTATPAPTVGAPTPGPTGRAPAPGAGPIAAPHGVTTLPGAGAGDHGAPDEWRVHAVIVVAFATIATLLLRRRLTGER